MPLQTLTLFPTDEMESWQLRFLNGTTVTGAGMPPELWVKQPVQEKLETKGSNDNLKGLRQFGPFGGPPPISPGLPGNPGIPQEGLRQLSPPIHPDLPGNTEGRGKGGLRQFLPIPNKNGGPNGGKLPGILG